MSDRFFLVTDRNHVQPLLDRINSVFAPEIAAGRFTTWATADQVINVGAQYLIPVGVHMDRIGVARRATLAAGEIEGAATVSRDDAGKPTRITFTPREENA